MVVQSCMSDSSSSLDTKADVYEEEENLIESITHPLDIETELNVKKLTKDSIPGNHRYYGPASGIATQTSPRIDENDEDDEADDEYDYGY